MTFNTLISPSQLHEYGKGFAVVDCRFSLADTEKGRRDYLSAHIPGAVYAHLDEDLSGPVVPGKTGRHPLPDVETFARRLSSWGIGNNTQVVVYDDTGGSIASRLWWMLRWLGHQAVAVLDGGWQAWLGEGYPTRGGEESRPAARFVPHLRPELLVSTAEVQERFERPDFLLIDSRSPERYRGENEPLDPVAGHIPGALNAPHTDTVGPNGVFRSPEELRQHFGRFMQSQHAEKAVFYCGSGVTAARNLLALLHAGLGEARLYAGSWSEWITDPQRPVARG